MEDISAKQAFRLATKYNLILIGKIFLAIDRFVRKYTWYCMVFIIICAMLTSYYFIHQARAERDQYQVTNYRLQTSLDSIKVINNR